MCNAQLDLDDDDYGTECEECGEWIEEQGCEEHTLKELLQERICEPCLEKLNESEARHMDWLNGYYGSTRGV